MKLTSRKLRQLIREELSRTLLEAPYDEAPDPSVDALKAASLDILVDYDVAGHFPMGNARDTPNRITFSTDESATQFDREDAVYDAERALPNLQAAAEEVAAEHGYEHAEVEVTTSPYFHAPAIIFSYY